ncbi:ion transporter [Candidatus Altiarchaeota archaeon]
MDEYKGQITWKHVLWDIIIFTAVIGSVISLSLELAYDLDEDRLIILYLIDITALTLFTIDLWILWRNFNGPLKEFLFRNWMDILSAIPVFRIIRIARFARILKLARLRRLNKLKRVSEVKGKIDEERSN